MTVLSDLVPFSVPHTTPAGERVLDAAAELFYLRGIGAVGVDLIADTAGVTKRTLYQRFGSKEELVVAYLTHRANRWQTLVLDTLRNKRTAAGRVDAIFVVARQWAETNSRGCAFVNAWAEFGTAKRHPVADVVRDEKQWMRALFDAAIGDRRLAEHVQLLYEGAQVTATTMGRPDALSSAGRIAVGLVRAG